jgi:hypothetical protein
MVKVIVGVELEVCPVIVGLSSESAKSSSEFKKCVSSR